MIIECAKKLNDVTFHLVGGLTEDINYWKNYLKNLNLNNVYFYGFVSPNETIKYRNSLISSWPLIQIKFLFMVTLVTLVNLCLHLKFLSICLTKKQ